MAAEPQQKATERLVLATGLVVGWHVPIHAAYAAGGGPWRGRAGAHFSHSVVPAQLRGHRQGAAALCLLSGKVPVSIPPPQHAHGHGHRGLRPHLASFLACFLNCDQSDVKQNTRGGAHSTPEPPPSPQVQGAGAQNGCPDRQATRIDRVAVGAWWLPCCRVPAPH